MSANKMTNQDMSASRTSDKGADDCEREQFVVVVVSDANEKASISLAELCPLSDRRNLKINKRFIRSRTRRKATPFTSSPSTISKLSRYKLHSLTLLALLTQLIIAHNHYSITYCLSIGRDKTTGE